MSYLTAAFVNASAGFAVAIMLVFLGVPRPVLLGLEIALVLIGAVILVVQRRQANRAKQIREDEL